MKPPKKSRSRSSAAVPSEKKTVPSRKESARRAGKTGGKVLRVVLVSSSSFLHGVLKSCSAEKGLFSIVGWVRNAREAAAFSLKVDVAVVDLENEKVSLSFVRSLKNGAHAVGVALHPADAVIPRALAAGVHSLITTEDDPECHLCLAIQAAAANSCYFTPLLGLMAKVVPDKNGAPREKLTARESQAVDLMRQGKQRLEIGEVMKVTPKTVDKFLTAAAEKFGVRGMQNLREHVSAPPKPEVTATR